jgi:hypothetical protein
MIHYMTQYVIQSHITVYSPQVTIQLTVKDSAEGKRIAHDLPPCTYSLQT